MSRIKRDSLVLRESNYEMLHEYYEWLSESVGVSDHDGYSYWILMDILWQTRFIPKLSKDEHRERDGQNLREDFVVEYGYYLTEEESMFHCSMLEMIIAIAYRAADMTEEPMQYWFWTIMYNLDLHDFTDDDFYEFGGRAKVQLILDRVITRRYKKDGNQGLFPLAHPEKDQRRVEIFYQMCAYLNENWQF